MKRGTVGATCRRISRAKCFGTSFAYPRTPRRAFHSGGACKRVKHGFQCLLWCLSARVHMDVGFAVEHFAFDEDSFQVGHRVAVVRHRTQVALFEHPLHVVGWRGAQPDRAAARQQLLERPDSETRLPPVASTKRGYRLRTVSRHFCSSRRNPRWPRKSNTRSSVRPLSSSMRRSSSRNGISSRSARAAPTVDLPAPRKPTNAIRLCRVAASGPPKCSNSSCRARFRSSSGSRRRNSTVWTKLDRRFRAFEQERIQRHREGLGDLVQHQEGQVAVAKLNLREISLGDAGLLGEQLSRHPAPGSRLADTFPKPFSRRARRPRPCSRRTSFSRDVRTRPCSHLHGRIRHAQYDDGMHYKSTSSIPVLHSFLGGKWTSGAGAEILLQNPSTGAPIARTSSSALDLASALDFSRTVGRAGLRSLSFGERAGCLARVAEVLASHRARWGEIARINSGNTAADAAIDIDGAIGTLKYFAKLGGRHGRRWPPCRRCGRATRSGSELSGRPHRRAR